MTDNVVPFGRRGQRAAPPEPVEAKPWEHGLHPRTLRAQPGAAKLAAEQSAEALQRHRRASYDQRDARLIASGRVVPARITLAMNLMGHEGPDVDLACGTVEGRRDGTGDVDMWELGLAVPSPEQVRLMAAFTDFPEVWFYKPMPPGPMIGREGEPGFVFMCGPGGCNIVQSDYVDEDGVLQYGGEPKRTLPEVVEGLPIPEGPKVERPKRAPVKKMTAAEQAERAESGRMPDRLRAELAEKLGWKR